MLKKYLSYTKSRFSKRIFLLILLFFNESYSFYDVSTGTDEIKIDSETKLVLLNQIKKKCFQPEPKLFCRPEVFFIVKNEKFFYSFPDIVEEFQGFYYYFVKINENNYIQDLDNDGNFEFAIYPTIAGNNPVTEAYIYTFKNQMIIPYGKGKHFWEKGRHVVNIKKY